MKSTFTWRCFLYILMAKSGSSTVQYNLKDIQKAFTGWDTLLKYQLKIIYMPITLMINYILIVKRNQLLVTLEFM